MDSRPRQSRPHTRRWLYRMLYNAGTFERTSRMYPFFSRGTFQRVCRFVAAFYAWSQRGVREVVRDNLRLLNPSGASAGDAARVFDRFATTIADYVVVRAMKPDEVGELIESHQGLEHLENATRGGKGVILATGHYSFFELGTVTLSRLGHTVSIVTLPEPSEALTSWRSAWRSRWGTRTIEVGRDAFSSLAIVHALQEGHCTAMLVDRPFGSHSQKVALPGGDLLFSTSPAQLSWVTGCAVLPVVISLLPSGKYRITTKPAIHSGSGGDRNAAIALCTQRIAESLFEEIGKDPSQWYQFVPVRVH